MKQLNMRMNNDAVFPFPQKGRMRKKEPKITMQKYIVFQDQNVKFSASCLFKYVSVRTPS